MRDLRGATWPVRMADPRWVWSSVRTWTRDAFLRPDDAFRGLRNEWLVARWLYTLVRLRRPTRVVETGVHLGKSSVALLSALNANGCGHLMSIDLPHAAPVVNGDGRVDNAHVRRDDETGSLVPQHLRSRWTLRLGDARDLLPRAVEDGVDFFIHDSYHSEAHQRWEYETVFAASSRGTIIASDDTTWTPAWERFVRAHRERLTELRVGPTGHRAALVSGVR